MGLFKGLLKSLSPTHAFDADPFNIVDKKGKTNLLDKDFLDFSKSKKSPGLNAEQQAILEALQGTWGQPPQRGPTNPGQIPGPINPAQPADGSFMQQAMGLSGVPFGAALQGQQQPQQQPPGIPGMHGINPIWMQLLQGMKGFR